MPKSRSAAILRTAYVVFAVGLISLLAILLFTDIRIPQPELPPGTRQRRTPMGPALVLGDSMRLLTLRFWTWYVVLWTSPLFLAMARRFPIARERWARGFAVHFGVTTLVVLFTSVVWNELAGRWVALGPPGFDLGLFVRAQYLTDSLPFWVMIAAIHALEFYRRSREHELKTVQLQAQLAESRLDALAAQLHPHFLFNTLQGISTLMHRDAAAADSVLSHLSDLLRHALHTERQEVSLGEELDVLEHYVAISRIRFKDHLVFETAVSDEAAHAAVPFFVLQPLVENAVEHGVARRKGAGRIEVSAARRNEELVLTVTDDGPGVTDASSPEGIGLTNTRQRLHALYGDHQAITLETPVGGGCRAVVTIPFRRIESGGVEGTS